MDFLITGLDRLQAGVNEHLDPRRDRRCEAEIISRHAVDHGPCFVAAHDGKVGLSEQKQFHQLD